MKIVVDNVTKDFGTHNVLKDISVKLLDSRFIGILGPNGAGKSTLIKIITNQIKATQGQVTWVDDDGHVMTISQRAQYMGIVHQTSMLDAYLTVKENLIVRGAIRKLSKKAVLQRILELNEVIEINSLLNVRYMNLSGGQKRRVDIVVALLHNPKIIILDEPTTGIDPEVRAELWSAIHELRHKNSISVILITHYLEEMADVDELIVLLHGGIRYDGHLKEFVAQNSSNLINLSIRNKKGKVELYPKTYSSIDDKMALLQASYETGNLIDFTDQPVSLERAYLNMLNEYNNSEEDQNNVEYS